MSMLYNNQVYDEIDTLTDYYMKKKIEVTVENVCNHSISRNLNRTITLQIISYFYGINQYVALNNTNNIIRQMGIIGMKKFEKAINILEYNHNYHNQLYILANRNVEHSSLNSNNNTQRETPITNNQINDVFHTPERVINNAPSTPPPLLNNIRYSQNTVSETQPIEIDRFIPTVRRLRFDSDIFTDNEIQEHDDDECVFITSIQDYEQSE
jgi:hypothetical protein